MNLTLDGLRRREFWKKAGVAIPTYEIGRIRSAAQKEPVWVHFGIGNIFRIFMGCLLYTSRPFRGAEITAALGLSA